MYSKNLPYESALRVAENFEGGEFMRPPKIEKIHLRKRSHFGIKIKKRSHRGKKRIIWRVSEKFRGLGLKEIKTKNFKMLIWCPF